MSERRCNRCGQFQPITNFGIRKRRGTPTAYCRRCDVQVSNESARRRKGIPEIRSAMRTALKQHGPLTTVDLVVEVKRIILDAYPVNAGIIGQNGIQLRRAGEIVSTLRPRHGSLWALYGETREYRYIRPGPKKYQTKIGMDAENLAWLEEQRQRAEQRRRQCLGIRA